MADKLEHSHFVSHKGSTFKAKGEDGELEVKLVDVSQNQTDNIKGFSLLFEGPVDNQLLQGTYAMSHEDVGEHDIFITPVKADIHATDVVHYEAVFQRLKDEENTD